MKKASTPTIIIYYGYAGICPSMTVGEQNDAMSYSLDWNKLCYRNDLTSKLFIILYIVL